MIDKGKITDDSIATLSTYLPEVLFHYKKIPIEQSRNKPNKVRCPFHDDHKPSMNVNPNKGLYYCFACQAKGNIFDLVAKEENLDPHKDFRRIAEIISHIANVAIKTKENYREESAPSKPDRPTSLPASPPKPVEYIPMSVVNAMAGRARETSLYMWLCRYFAPADVDLVFAMYRVGASKYINPQGGRAVSFPYMPDAEHCVDCRITHINPNTGSRKDAKPLQEWTKKDGSKGKKETTWALAEMKKTDLRAPMCNFGDHLLSMRPGAKVCIVESEKSAIILALAYPDRIWLATNGESKLTADKMKSLRGRKVTICPDRDGYKAWSEKAKEFARNYDISLDDTILKHKGDDKDDLADIVIRSLEGMPTTTVEPTPQPQPQVQLSPDEKQTLDLWAQMQVNNPHLSEFAKELSLTPVRVVPNKTTNHGEDKQ